MSDTEMSRKIYDAGRIIKFIGIIALAVQLIGVGVAEIFAVLIRMLRLVENTWFWIFVGLVVIGILMQKYAKPKIDSYLNTSRDRGDAGKYSVEDDSPGDMPGI